MKTTGSLKEAETKSEQQKLHVFDIVRGIREDTVSIGCDEKETSRAKKSSWKYEQKISKIL